MDIEELDDFYKKAFSCGRPDEMAAFDAEELLTGLGLYEKDREDNPDSSEGFG